jgi:hypothetical protein
MDFDTESGNVLLFEFTCKMAFDEGSLSKYVSKCLGTDQNLGRMR